jgi:hypothetical protein
LACSLCSILDDGHKLRRIRRAGVDGKGKPLNVKGVQPAPPPAGSYVSTLTTLTCF